MKNATAAQPASLPCPVRPAVLLLLSLVLLAAPGLAQEKPSHGVSEDLLRLAESAAKRQTPPAEDVLPIRDGYVVVDFASQTPDLLLRDLEGLGLLGGAVYGYVVSGLLPVSSISALTALPTLQLARPAYARAGTGAVDSEGDQSMRSDVARDIYAIDGTGITVGTLSDSYNCLGGAPGDVTSNDLPGGVVVLADLAIATSPNCTDEGRAMMQIVHDIAPGVAQGFHTAFNGQADFALGIEELAGCPPGSAAGCTPSAGFAADVINDDVFYFAEPFFQDGVVAQAVDRVVASGIAYFTLAGNHGRESYQAPFRTSGTTGGGGGTLHDFDPGGGTDTSQRITIPAVRPRTPSTSRSASSGSTATSR